MGKETEGGQRVYFKRLGLKMLPVWDRFPALGQEAQQLLVDFSQDTKQSQHQQWKRRENPRGIGDKSFTIEEVPYLQPMSERKSHGLEEKAIEAEYWRNVAPVWSTVLRNRAFSEGDRATFPVRSCGTPCLQTCLTGMAKECSLN